MTTFDRAFGVVVGSEGGYANSPADPGGETNWGISKRAYPGVDIKALTIDDAKAIYRRDYWDRVRGDDLPAPLALCVFDAAVNNGVDRAAKWLQIAAGATQDGVIGPATMAAIGKKPLVAVLVELHAQRMRFMFALPTATTFGLGWARRLAALPFAAIGLEEASAPPPAPVAPPLDAKAIQDAVEVAMRKVLEERAYTDALNQRPAP